MKVRKMATKEERVPIMLACQDCEKNTSFQNLSYDVGQE